MEAAFFLLKFVRNLDMCLANYTSINKNNSA